MDAPPSDPFPAFLPSTVAPVHIELSTVDIIEHIVVHGRTPGIIVVPPVTDVIDTLEPWLRKKASSPHEGRQMGSPNIHRSAASEPMGRQNAGVLSFDLEFNGA